MDYACPVARSPLHVALERIPRMFADHKTSSYIRKTQVEACLQIIECIIVVHVGLTTPRFHMRSHAFFLVKLVSKCLALGFLKGCRMKHKHAQKFTS